MGIGPLKRSSSVDTLVSLIADDGALRMLITTQPFVASHVGGMLCGCRQPIANDTPNIATAKKLSSDL